MKHWYIKMLGTHRGSNSGFDVTPYYKDTVYEVGVDIGDSLARSFIGKAWATEVENGNGK